MSSDKEVLRKLIYGSFIYFVDYVVLDRLPPPCFKDTDINGDKGNNI